MARSALPDYSSRTPEGLARTFDSYADYEVPQIGAPLYEHLCRGIARDPELLALAALAPVTQPAPNLLLGAAHYLLLRGERHALRDWYADLNGGECRDPSGALPVFREFCLGRRERVAELIATRFTQTNVIGRCSGLLPAFARVFRNGGERPLALIEIGPSAGLNLQWHRYRYSYRRAGADSAESTWGAQDAKVHVEAELRGAPLPPLPERIPVPWRRGVDLSPISIDDEDAITWLRALVWPDHVGRQERLSAAIAEARSDPPQLIQGDAAERLPELIRAAPTDTTLCVYGTHTLYQFPAAALRGLFRALEAASRERPLDFVSSEGTGDGFSELKHTTYRGGEFRVEDVARGCPHGRWLEWIAAD